MDKFEELFNQNKNINRDYRDLQVWQEAVYRNVIINIHPYSHTN